MNAIAPHIFIQANGPNLPAPQPGRGSFARLIEEPTVQTSGNGRSEKRDDSCRNGTEADGVTVPSACQSVFGLASLDQISDPAQLAGPASEPNGVGGGPCPQLDVRSDHQELISREQADVQSLLDQSASSGVRQGVPARDGAASVGLAQGVPAPLEGGLRASRLQGEALLNPKDDISWGRPNAGDSARVFGFRELGVLGLSPAPTRGGRRSSAVLGADEAGGANGQPVQAMALARSAEQQLALVEVETIPTHAVASSAKASPVQLSATRLPMLSFGHAWGAEAGPVQARLGLQDKLESVSPGVRRQQRVDVMRALASSDQPNLVLTEEQIGLVQVLATGRGLGGDAAGLKRAIQETLSEFGLSSVDGWSDAPGEHESAVRTIGGQNGARTR